MKRHKSLYSLSHDHHHGLILANLIKKNAPGYKNLPKTFEGKVEYLINFYETELINHFREEEEILFPAVKGRNENLDNLFKDIFDDHNQFHSLIKKIKVKADVELLDNFGNLLDDHIRKEERELFRLVQEVLNDDELQKLESELKRAGEKKTRVVKNNLNTFIVYGL